MIARVRITDAGGARPSDSDDAAHPQAPIAAHLT